MMERKLAHGLGLMGTPEMRILLAEAWELA